jgi:hypothetical protein
MQVQLKNVRFNYVNTLKARSFDNDPKTARFSATLLLEEGSDEMQQMEDAILEVAKEKWDAKAPGMLKKLRKEERTCLRDGDGKFSKDGDPVAGFEGHHYVSATNKSRPHTLNKFKETITLETDGEFTGERRGPRSGDYGAAMVSIWAQDNKFGQRINCQLDAIMFLREGDPLGGSGGVSLEGAVNAFAGLGEDPKDASLFAD